MFLSAKMIEAHLGRIYRELRGAIADRDRRPRRPRGPQRRRNSERGRRRLTARGTQEAMPRQESNLRHQVQETCVRPRSASLDHARIASGPESVLDRAHVGRGTASSGVLRSALRREARPAARQADRRRARCGGHRERFRRDQRRPAHGRPSARRGGGVDPGCDRQSRYRPGRTSASAEATSRIRSNTSGTASTIQVHHGVPGKRQPCDRLTRPLTTSRASAVSMASAASTRASRTASRMPSVVAVRERWPLIRTALPGARPPSLVPTRRARIGSYVPTGTAGPGRI